MYVDGTEKPPPTIPSTTEGQPNIVNPAFVKWEKQDQILLGWLLSSLTEGVLGRVSGLDTSREVWQALEKRYATKTKAHKMQLKRQLHNLKKGNDTMQEYFSKAKKLFDAHAASGTVLSEEDMQQTVLAGLDQAYDAIVTSLSTLENIDMDTFHAHLLNYDMRLESQLSILQQPTTNLASSSSTRSNQRPNQRRNSNQYNRQPYQQRQNNTVAPTWKVQSQYVLHISYKCKDRKNW